MSATTPTLPSGPSALDRGLRLTARGPAPDAWASLVVARDAPSATPAESLTAALAAADVAWAAGDHPGCVAAVEAALHVVGDEPGFLADHLTGMLALLAERRRDAVGPLRRAVTTGLASTSPQVLVRCSGTALLLGDVRAAARAAALALAVSRAHQDAGTAVRAVEQLAYAELRAGHHALAREHATTGLRAARRSGLVNATAHHHAVLALVASVQDTAATTRRHSAAATTIARRHGLAQPVTLAQWALARVELRQGDAGAAADRLRTLLDGAGGGAHFALRGLVLPTWVEAAVAAGAAQDARGLLPELERWAEQAADPQTPALVLRSRALLAATDEAHDLFERAHAAHRDAEGDFERARTLLLHGRWLRRRRRPADARDRLRTALTLFDRCGAPPWAAAARAELRSAGAARADDPVGAGPGALGALTPHQQRIARLVAAGGTNREIAARLSVSVRTVDCHLRNVFVALGVRSRVELARLVPAEDA
jgi:DNA-binding CsgD family transcriptional regulator